MLKNQKEFNALTPQQKVKFRKMRSENPYMPFAELLARTKETDYVSDVQRDAFQEIVKINRLQKPELIELALIIARKSVSIAKERGACLDDMPGIVAEIIERAQYGLFRRMFTQAELKGVTLHTLKALRDKGILEEHKPYGEEGAVYWKLTGKELK